MPIKGNSTYHMRYEGILGLSNGLEGVQSEIHVYAMVSATAIVMIIITKIEIPKSILKYILKKIGAFREQFLLFKAIQ